MDDLVERLRQKELSGSKVVSGQRVMNRRNFDGDEAADRIEQLEAENARLEQALRIEIWNQRMSRGGEQDGVIAAINAEIASIKTDRATITSSAR